VSFNTRSNIFGQGGAIQSPIQRMNGSGMVLSGGIVSDDNRNNPAVEQSILRGMKMMMMSDTENSMDALRIGDQHQNQYQN
jgi:hypothetical protein